MNSDYITGITFGRIDLMQTPKVITDKVERQPDDNLFTAGKVSTLGGGWRSVHSGLGLLQSSRVVFLELWKKTGTQEHWNTGTTGAATLEHWTAGPLVHWNTGAMEHWAPIIPLACW